MANAPNEPSPGGRSFDVSSLTGRLRRSDRTVLLLVLGAAALILLLWAGLVLPLFFEAPHPLSSCLRYYDCNVPSSGYYIYAGGQTAVLVPIGAVLGAIGVRMIRQLGRKVVWVDDRGFAVDFGPKSRRRLSWEAMSASCILHDNSARWTAQPALHVYFPTPFSVQSDRWFSFLTEPAFRAILASARAFGCSIEVTPTDEFGESRTTYRVRPPRSAATAPTAS